MKRAAAFISWSTMDSRVEPLADTFKMWLYSLFQGEIDFFFSREIEPGEAPMPSVYEALNAADLGFIFLSQRTARSPWVIFESGCLNPSLRKGKVYPLLFDLSPKELRRICPPLADFQAVELRSRDDVRRLVDKIGRQVGLDDPAALSVRERFHQTYGELEHAIRVGVDSRQMLPDRFTGMIAYNDTIAGSENFQMPQIFDQFRKDLLFVGINLNSLLNLDNNTETSLPCWTG